MKKVLIVISALLLAAMIAIPAVSFLQITAPMNMALTIKAYGTGPTLDIIDHVGGTAGANAAAMVDPDKYVIDFGANGGRGPEIVPSRNQKVQVGSCIDYIFKLDNNYDRTMTLDLWVSVKPVAGLSIEIWENAMSGPDPHGTWLQWIIDDSMAPWDLKQVAGVLPGTIAVEESGFRAHNPGNSYIKPGEDYRVFIVIKTGKHYTGSDYTPGGTSTYTPLLKIVATSEPPFTSGNLP